VATATTPLRRADELLRQMTVEEKAMQLSAVYSMGLLGPDGPIPSQLEAEKRKQAAQAEAEKAEDDAEKRGKVDRLEQLEKKSDPLEVKDAAVRAADEARRLREAAATTKEKRKANSGGGQ
jgi:hypothetical protein